MNKKYAMKFERKYEQKFDFQYAEACISKVDPEEIQEILKSQIHQFNKDTVALDELKTIIYKLKSSNIIELNFVLLKILQFLSLHCSEAHIQQVLDLDILQLIFDLVKVDQDMPIITYEVASIINFITKGDFIQTQLYIKKGGLDVLLKLIQYNEQEIQEQTVQALGQIAGSSKSFRDLLLMKGTMELIIKVIQKCYQTSSSCFQHSVQALTTLCSGEEPHPDFNITKQALQIFPTIIENTQDEEILQNVLWAIQKFSENENQQAISEILNSGIMEKFIIKLLSDKNKRYVSSSLKIISNILAGNEQETDYILNLNINFKDLLQNGNNQIIESVCFCLSNITAGSPQQVKKVIQDKQLIEQLSGLLSNSFDQIICQIAWIFANATIHGDAKDLINFMDKQLITVYSNYLLDLRDKHAQTAILEGISNLLSKGEELAKENNNSNKILELINENTLFLKKILYLQGHISKKIFLKALEIQELMYKLNNHQ